jgi:hypothetical protein
LARQVPASATSLGREATGLYPLPKSLLLIAGHSRLFIRGMELARAAITEFFLPQFETLLFPGLRPVMTLAHPLDERLPFRPQRLRQYLGYMQVVLKTMGFILDSCGSAARPEVARMFRALCRLYYLSSAVYRRCQSTTSQRLPLLASPYSLLIRLFDPHLHCVPSLHILAVCYNYWAAGQVLRRQLPAGHPALSRVPDLFAIAVSIAETVLLVKQHSVLDIAPSLFLLSRCFPGYDDAEAQRFVGALFRRRPAVGRALRKEVLCGYRELARFARRDPAADPGSLVVEYICRHAAANEPAAPRSGAGRD